MKFCRNWLVWNDNKYQTRFVDGRGRGWTWLRVRWFSRYRWTMFILPWLDAFVKDLTNNWQSWRRFTSFVCLSLCMRISVILSSIVLQNLTCLFFIIFHRVQLCSRVYAIWLLDAWTFRCVAQYLLSKSSVKSASAIPKDFSLRLWWVMAAGAQLVPGLSCKNRRVKIVLTTEGEK